MKDDARESIDALISIASSAIRELPPPHAIPGKGEVLVDLLSRRNGFYAFESALHVFPSGPPTVGRSLEEWNFPALWRDHYGDLIPDAYFFAEDIFGMQFAVMGRSVLFFNSETAALSVFADGIAEWAERVVEDYDQATGFSVGHEWQSLYGALLPGHRLIPKVPFIFGGEFAIDNMVPVEAAAAMRYRGRIAVEISDIPDGEQLRFNPKIIDELICARWAGAPESTCVCFDAT
jgi:hypothetical protein